MLFHLSDNSLPKRMILIIPFTVLYHSICIYPLLFSLLKIYNMYPGTAVTKKIIPASGSILDFQKMSKQLKKSSPSMIIPAANFKEYGSEYRLLLATPGLLREDFNIEIKEQVIFISAKSEIKNVSGKNDHCEYDYSDWTRAFSLPADADTLLAHAKYRHGELLIRIPRGNTKESNDHSTVYVY